MKPKIKPRQTITIHRDGTVSFFDVLAQQWERMPAKHVNATLLATLTQEDRNRILAVADATR